MDARSVYSALCVMGSIKAKVVLEKAIREFGVVLADVYNDIYNSCIKVYYSSYTPTVYKRHGDKLGFNLYSGFYSNVNNFRIDARYTPESLMPYRNATQSEVLQAVIDGQRGLKERHMPKTGNWPKNWVVQYPNAYSRYSFWVSNKSTVDEILDDFRANAGKSLANVFWDIAAKYI